METKQFLDYFRSNNSKIEYTKNANIVITEEEALNNETDNIYYLGGVDRNKQYSGYKRAGELDIIEKNYLVIDLDIRKNYEALTGYILTDKEIKEELVNIGNFLKTEDEILGDFDFIVFSGNGGHIYYLGNFQTFTPDEYAFGVKRVYSRWNKIWRNVRGSNIFDADSACKNISRIIRLPGTINAKTGKKTEILVENKGTGRIFNSLKALSKKEKEEEIQKREEQIRKNILEYEENEKIQKLIHGQRYLENKTKTQNTFDKINNVPAYLVAEKILPNFTFDGKKNFLNKKKGYCGYYYIKDLNAIANGGSRHFNWGDVNSCWSPANLIKKQFDFTWKEVIDYFSNYFNI